MQPNTDIKQLMSCTREANYNENISVSKMFWHVVRYLFISLPVILYSVSLAVSVENIANITSFANTSQTISTRYPEKYGPQARNTFDGMSKHAIYIPLHP